MNPIEHVSFKNPVEGDYFIQVNFFNADVRDPDVKNVDESEFVIDIKATESLLPKLS
jgi:hypothetical protein